MSSPQETLDEEFLQLPSDSFQVNLKDAVEESWKLDDKNVKSFLQPLFKQVSIFSRFPLFKTELFTNCSQQNILHPSEWRTPWENKLQICKMKNIRTKTLFCPSTIAVKRSGESPALFEKFSMHFPVDVNWCQRSAMNYCRKSWKLSRSERWYFMIHCRMFVSFHSLCSFILGVTKSLNFLQQFGCLRVHKFADYY